MTMQNKKTVLIVDDEEDLRELLSLTVQQMQLQPVAVGTVKEAKKLLANTRFDLCITDMNLPDGNGIELVRYIHRHHGTTPVAMLTAYGNMETATLAMKEGAYDFIAKPVSLARLRQVIEEGLATQHPHTELLHQQLVSNSTKTQELRRKIELFARSDAPLYLHSHPGSNAAGIAKLIHEASPRAPHPFIHISCFAPSTKQLTEALFGVYGIDGDISTYQPGVIAAAHQGTLFLEDITALPANVQLQLLQALEARELHPEGSLRSVPFNVRVITSSDEDLTQAVAEKRFRQDLYFRLNVIELKLPNLNDRLEDIPALAEYYLAQLSKRYAVPRKPLTPAAATLLSQHNYTGDLQELENILERAFTLCDADSIGPEHLGIKTVTTHPLSTATNSSLDAARPHDQPLEAYLEEIERREILQALEQTLWNRTAAAKRLGMSFRALRYRLQKLAINKPEDN
ncbi:MAG TPA: sigma-54 dependent transcriptional regulator [Alcanivoracaceae bacterium]|nr:sigma-54 dependent transcriptional regulator [Alcanivoracaceae bacterium]